MNDGSRIHSLSACYENSITTILRLGAQQQAIQNSQIFRNNISAILKAAMEQARSIGYSDEMIKLGLAAVVAFIDESVLMLQLPSFADWAKRPLQEELFGHARMGEVFFENIRKLLSRPDSQETADCLEVYCLCLQLGFRGRYALAGEAEVDSFIRRIREKMERSRGPLRFLQVIGPPPEVKQSESIDGWSRGLGVAALCLLLLMLLAFGGFWWMLSSGASRLG